MAKKKEAAIFEADLTLVSISQGIAGYRVDTDDTSVIGLSGVGMAVTETMKDPDFTIGRPGMSDVPVPEEEVDSWMEKQAEFDKVRRLKLVIS